MPSSIPNTRQVGAAAEQDEPTSPLSYRRYLWAGSFALVALVGGVGGWAAFAEISGAVIAEGTVAMEGRTKPVQHLAGGIVKEILVGDGDAVRAGDVLIRLDHTAISARLAAVEHRIVEATNDLVRLQAERDGTEYRAPIGLDDLADAAELESASERQHELLAASRANRLGQVDQLRRQIDQLTQSAIGTLALRESKQRQLEIAQQELAAIGQLVEKGYAARSQALALERDVARLSGETGELDAEIERSDRAAKEAEVAIEQVEREYMEQVSREVARVSADLLQAREERVALLDELTRVEIRAPVGGFIHELVVRSPGAVISAGEAILTVVPTDQPMVIEARIPVDQIDQISVGRKATVLFTAFNRQTTPEINAVVDEVSADRVVDRATGASWYPVILGIPKQELDRLADLHLVAGMPAEVFVTTDSRTPLGYLLKPLTDHLRRAMKE